MKTIEITDGLYRELAKAVLNEIGFCDDYVMVTARVERKHYYVELNLSAVLYYDKTAVELDRGCYGSQKVLVDIVPTWWDLTSFVDEDGYDLQVANDAKWDKLKNEIMNL